MTKLKLFFITLCLTTSTLYGQDWDIFGNLTTDANINFVGTLDDEDLRFRTDNTFRLGINGSNGWLGLNTTAPLGMFHQRHGDFIVETNLMVGVDGQINTPIAVPAFTGIVPRLMFIESAAAFRVGGADAAWDVSNIGQYSLASGWDNAAAGDRSAAFGTGNSATGTNAAVFGNQNLASGFNAFCAGANNEVTETNSIGLGSNNFVTGYSSMAIGEFNDVLETNSTGIGTANVTNGIFNFAFGRFNSTSADHSMGIGCFTENLGEGSIILGYGVDLANRLTNNVNSSLVVGFNSDLPTLFVGPSAGAGTTGNVGIGNITTPTERLDVFGTARLRQIPDSIPDVLITGVEQDSLGDYVLNYLAFPNDPSVVLTGDGTWVPGSIDCEWNLVNNGGSDDLVMGYGGACNEGRVGIGVDVPDSKLAVKSTLLGGGLNKSIESVATGGTTVFGLKADAFADLSTTNVTGVGADVQGIEEVTFTTGVLGRARDGKYVVGVHGIGANGSVDNGTTVGVAGIAPELSSPGQRIAGVYAENNLAALYHVGPTVGSAQSWTISDENFKQSVTNNVPGIETILQIQPKSYEFMNEEFEFMNLPEGLQYGLLAQDLQAVLPNLVREASKPEIADPETGEILSPGIDHLAVNYDGLIPVLIKSVQEQQAMIDAQQAQIEALIDMVNACCEEAPGAKNASDSQGGLYDLKIEGPVLNQNVPNPFREATQITYILPDAAQVQLQVYNQQGALVETLAEGSLPAGEYQARWNANHLPTGTYIYVLRVNGQELVKRAVKMN